MNLALKDPAPKGLASKNPALKKRAPKRPVLSNFSVLSAKDTIKQISRHICFTTRPCVRGKFLFVGDEKFFVRGVTYGTFRPQPTPQTTQQPTPQPAQQGAPQDEGVQFPSPDIVKRDFALMQQNSINCLRVYTIPPQWLLDCAQRHCLRVMVGLPWEQHIAFLNNPECAREIEERMHNQVKSLGGHPAILMYAIGNEIPPTIVRWHGRKKIEAFIKRLYKTVKAADPEGLVTYVNFPTTEYLQLDFLDVISFNVYLERQDILEAYLSRLHNLAHDKPLVMTEIGLDSQRNGEIVQADVLDWQIKTVFASGCAGAFVFAWTDEWYRGGADIDNWDFGLTTRDRGPKPALAIVKNHFANVPFPGQKEWPRISVFVCSYNGSRTIRKTLSELARLDYPDYEVVVVNDGSTDETPQIAREFNVRLINTENRGLSVARNEALKDEAASIVVYIDDDAYPDPHWLKYIAHTFLTTGFAAVGGPNLLPLESSITENCVGNAPGGATHVLINDRVAEHIPGCNMAYRKEALKAIGGFDGQFRSAGDDVDVCWRIQKMGWQIGYHPAAYVWHLRRNRLKTYWRQQKGYGKAEAMLEKKWPDKYNAIGHVPWSGRLYGRGQTASLFSGRWRVYQGVWGSAPFQSIYEPAGSIFFSFPLMPEWYLLIALLGLLSILSLLWEPLVPFTVLFVLSVIAPIIQAVKSARRAKFTIKEPSFAQKVELYGLTAFLHLMQPLARLVGRVSYGLNPFKCRGKVNLFFPRKEIISIWQEEWHSSEEILGWIDDALKEQNVPVFCGGQFDAWDLEVRGGLLGGARLLLTREEHAWGKQMLHFAIAPNCKISRTWVIGLFTVLAVFAATDQAWIATLVLFGLGGFTALRTLQKCAYAKTVLVNAVNKVKGYRYKEKKRLGTNLKKIVFD